MVVSGADSCCCLDAHLISERCAEDRTLAVTVSLHIGSRSKVEICSVKPTFTPVLLTEHVLVQTTCKGVHSQDLQTSRNGIQRQKKRAVHIQIIVRQCTRRPTKIWQVSSSTTNSSRVSTVSSSSPPVFLLASTFPPCLPSVYLVFRSCPPLVSFLCLFCHPPVTTTPLSHDKKQGVFSTKAMKARVFVVCPFFPERVAGHLATSQS